MEKADIRKIQVLSAGAFAVFFTGFPHIWSIYQPYVMEGTGWSQTATSLCFYVYFIFFVFGNILGGRLQVQYTPKLPIWTGGGIFTAGLLLASFSLTSVPLFMYLTYGIFQGTGQGMIYSTIISTAQKWYPDRPGFASGVIVTANGLFGFVMAPFCRKMLETTGINQNFLLMGILVGISWILSGSLIDNPPDIRKEKNPRFSGENTCTPREMIHTREYYFLTAVMFFGLLPYMLISPVAQSLQTMRGISVPAAVAAVMAGSICNAAARLLIPSIADRAGRMSCLGVVLGILVFAMAALTVAPRMLVSPAVILVYGCYGGIMGSFPSLTGSLFGIQYSGENYGYVLFGLAAATLCAPLLAGILNYLMLPEEFLFLAGAFSSFLSLFFLFRLGKTKRCTDIN